MNTIENTIQDFAIVELTVNYGLYDETLYGAGSTVLEAAEAAALQSDYANGLFDQEDEIAYEDRAHYRLRLAEALEAGKIYSGYGYSQFRLVGAPSER